MENQVHEPDEQQTAVVQQTISAPMLIPTEAFGAQTVQKAEKLLDIYTQLRVISFKALAPKDFLNLGGKPYLTEAGAMKFAGIYGVSFKNIRVTQSNYEDEVGPVVAFQAEVTAVFQNRQDTEIGMAASSEDFFKRKVLGKEETQRVPLSEIKVADVMKKAITNAKGRATRKILGLSFTWEEVKANFARAGKKAGDMVAVQYKGKSGERNTTTGKGTVNATKTELANKIFAMCEGNQEDAAEMLYSYSKFNTKDGNERGARSVKDMSDKWAEKTLEKVNEVYESFMAEQGKSPDDMPY